MPNVKSLIGLARFETALALTLIAVPIVLRLEDQSRSSISDYHDITDPRWFFVPLTAAVMMLITNGLVSDERHGLNAILGLLLLGVILFDHDGASNWFHTGVAFSFFVISLAAGALVVGDLWDAGRSRLRLRVLTIALSMALVLGVVLLISRDRHPLFWVEAAGLVMIAFSHAFHSIFEVVHPDRVREPATILKEVVPWLHGLLSFFLRPLVTLWALLNRKRKDAARELRADASA